MAGTPKQSGIYAGSMTVRGNNLQNSLGKVNISGLFNSMSDPRGVLTADAQINDYINTLPGADPNAYDSDGAVAPTTDSTGSDRKLTSEELRDIFSDNLTAGDIYGDTLAGYEGVRDAVTSAVIAAMQNDYLNSILESQLTPEEEEAQLLGLSVEQMNAKTEDMLDSILKSQGENETGFVNESARLAAEGILKGKIAQAGVTDPAAQEAALKSAMESLEGGASGLEAVKAAAGGAQDYVEELLKTAKDIIDKGYDATIGKLPEILTPEGILADIVSGNVTGVFEIGETGGALPGATSPIFGGTVGTVGGGTNVGIMTTGNAVLDAVIRAAEGGVDAGDIESVVGAVISANTGIPTDVVNAGIKGTKEAINAAKTVVGANVTGNGDGADDTTNITLTGGTLTTRTCDDGSVVGINEACPEDTTVTTRTCDDGSVVGINEACPEDTTVTTRTCEDGSLVGVNEACPEDTTVTTKTCDDGSVVDITEACPEDTTVTTRTCNSGSVVGINEACPEDLDDPCDNPKYATLNPVECGGVSDREIIDDDLVAEKDPCDDPLYAAENPAKCGVGDPPEKDCTDPEYAAANPIECAVDIVEEKDCTDPEYAAANPIECAVDIVEEKDCTDPEYAAQNPAKCGGSVNLCDDPVYAAQNPAKCGTIGGDPCDDPAYAASRPGECGTIGGDPCDDPAYAAANPAECGVVVPPGGTAVVPEATQGYRGVQTEPGELVDIEYLYDIAGPSIFAPTMEEEEKYNPLGMYSPYAEGGIVQDYDIEELIRYLAETRG
jgi:hypothetical protein